MHQICKNERTVHHAACKDEWVWTVHHAACKDEWAWTLNLSNSHKKIFCCRWVGWVVKAAYRYHSADTHTSCRLWCRLYILLKKVGWRQYSYHCTGESVSILHITVVPTLYLAPENKKKTTVRSDTTNRFDDIKIKEKTKYSYRHTSTIVRRHTASST